jgi:hypothetical protein
VKQREASCPRSDEPVGALTIAKGSSSWIDRLAVHNRESRGMAGQFIVT